MKGKAVRLDDDFCPNCAAKLSAASVAFGPKAKPKEGDPTLCVYCLEFAIFGPGLKLRKTTEIELRLTLDLEQYEHFAATREGLRAAKARYGMN